jgi:hypothetical protein
MTMPTLDDIRAMAERLDYMALGVSDGYTKAPPLLAALAIEAAAMLRALLAERERSDNARIIAREANEIARAQWPCNMAENIGQATVYSDAAGMLRELLAERDSITPTLIACVAVWAGEFARNNGLPDNHLHPLHYDTLRLYGARMDAFVRHEEAIIAKAAHDMHPWRPVTVKDGMAYYPDKRDEP